MTASAGLPVAGGAAHDAAVAGNPVLVGLEAKDFDGAALPNAVSAEGDAVRAAASLSGIQYVMAVNEDGSAVGTLNVNSHAVTNAGTFATQVDGAALTALQLIDDVVYVDDADFTDDASKFALVGGLYQSTPQSITDGDVGPILLDANGRIQVASHAVTNAGTFAVQVDGSALTALQLIDDVVFTDDAAFTPATSKVAAVGYFADEASTDNVTEGDVGIARMTLDRKVIVTPQPHTAGGLSIFRSLDLDETEEEVKATAGQVYGWAVTNTATATRWLKFYNDTAANVSVGTTTPVITWGIPGNSSDDVAANAFGAMGIKFDTAITVAAVTGVADNSADAPGANEVIVNIFYV